jgi:hypothetical protein
MSRPLTYIESCEGLVGNLGKEPVVKMYLNKNCSFFDLAEHGPWLDLQITESSERKQGVGHFTMVLMAPQASSVDANWQSPSMRRYCADE